MPETPRLIPLTYQPESAQWFTLVRHLPRSVWLDSGHPGSHYGRYDIISAAPQCWLETSGDLTQIHFNDGTCQESRADPFALIKHYLPLEVEPGTTLQTLPFIGGAIGYFAYDLGRRIEILPVQAQMDISLADMYLGIYPWAIVQDHKQQLAWLVINKPLSSAITGTYDFAEIEQLCINTSTTLSQIRLKRPLITESNPFKINKFKSNIDVKEYHLALAKIHAYILAGDSYQINFAQRFETEFEGDPFNAYLRLREALPSPFSGFIQLDNQALLSLSPERFIEVRGSSVETKPIKGTIKRGATPEEDLANANWLENSAKNRAENVMIVDLLRNDISKHCSQVQVPTLCELQSFTNVHHLVSTVTGRLRADASAIDVLRDAFPGGSITGAPKIRAMEIIEELEPTRRSVYCGSLGYISADGQMDTSIAIRTLVCDHNKLYCWGGGGIVADSETNQEYLESIAKVKILMDTLEHHFG